MFKSVLVANRGEIAARIIRSLKRLGITAIGVASDADRFTMPMRMADRVMRLPGNSVADSYLNVEAIIRTCRESGTEALHPGYGFLSENAEFALRLAAEGIVFIGPKPEHIRAFGFKHTAREIAERCGVPLLPGSGLLKNVEHALAEAKRISYPVMLKSTAGGGGIGMQFCSDAAELTERFANVARLAFTNFGDARVYLERYVATARHVEVQIFGDGKGGIVALGERDCSMQRRNQKVIEETPAPKLSQPVRDRLRADAVALGMAVSYESAGTVEFVYDVTRGEVYFLEVNTRLQVEHPVTEEAFGVDLVEWMIRQAADEFSMPRDGLISRGHAIEVRLYAEDPANAFRPSTGLITGLSLASDTRIETWVEAGTDVSPHYDPMLAKLVVHGFDRDDAIRELRIALDACAVWGIETNLEYLKEIVASEAFRSGDVSTATLKDVPYRPRRIEVLAPGTQSTLQDWPGRRGYWNVGVPPSGPMDERSHRLVNRIVGNAEHAATLECTLNGPTLRLHTDVVFAVGGAAMAATLDGAAVPYWTCIKAERGQVLALGAIAGPGMRTYVAVAGGFDAPRYLGSRATFTLGGFGGHGGRALKAGDVLRIGNEGTGRAYSPRADELPSLTRSWELAVLYGPHGAPEFFTAADIETLFTTEYEVHFNSARTGVRLVGPAPCWARPDGGEAGLHPSNIHDNAYAVGAIDFTGDMPIILGPDGPSLGGFVCPAVIAQGELWKVGQLKPGDKVRFRAVTLEDAATLRQRAPLVTTGTRPETDVLRTSDNGAVYRRCGDDNVLVEYGPMNLDLSLRLRAHLLMEALRERGPRGIIDLTPGIRSLQVHYDNDVLSETKLLDALTCLERDLPEAMDAVVESRIVHLPLSWNDPQAQLAMRKYQELVRQKAPWCPSNIEFIRRINGLASEDDVRTIVLAAEYLVLGLGDVYLGAPVATPVDPRHRLVTTKYNPARTWTPENAVGIGGAYLCVYGMEGPGGYQLFGRTIQMWNRWLSTDCFEEGKPWLLRFFDRIRFFPVTSEELSEARAAFPYGRYPLRIEDGQFKLRDHQAFLAANAAEILRTQSRQRQAFAAERQRWRDLGLDTYISDEVVIDADGDQALPENAAGIHAPTAATVWKILTAAGERVAAGQVLIVVESMKTEIPIESPISGIVRDIRCQPGRVVQAGQTLAVIEAAQ